MSTLLSELDFGSLLTYTPRPETEDQRKAQDVMYALKRERLVGTPPIAFSEAVAKRVRRRLSGLPFAGLFGPRTVLVPVPSSALKNPGDLRVPVNLARALEQEGLGIALDCLRRVEALPKAATSRAEDRPNALDHYRTLRVDARLESSTDIVLVDDVVTRGATLIGSASRLREHDPQARICAFAVMRAISRAAEFEALLDPCAGKVTLDASSNAFRNP